MNNIWQFIRRSLLTAEIPHVLEVGAHIGTETEKILEIIGYRPYRYHCFDPDPMNIKDLTRAAETNSWDVRIFQKAVSNFDGRATFHCSRGTKEGLRRVITDMGSLKKPINPQRVHKFIHFEDIEVEVCRLDTHLKNFEWDRIDLLWADVQGGELDVLDGMGEYLHLTRFIYLEHFTNIKYEGQSALPQIRSKLENFTLWHLDKYNALFGSVYG